MKSVGQLLKLFLNYGIIKIIYLNEDRIMKHKILVTGGAGFIGSHTIIELVNAGHEVVIVDNLVNSSEKSILEVEKIVGKSITFYNEDIRDRSKLWRSASHL